jgi:hypothetical protein
MKRLLAMLSLVCAPAAWAAPPQIIAMPSAPQSEQAVATMPVVQYPTTSDAVDAPAPTPAPAPAPVAAQPDPPPRVLYNPQIIIVRGPERAPAHERDVAPPPVPGLILPGARPEHTRQP